MSDLLLGSFSASPIQKNWKKLPRPVIGISLSFYEFIILFKREYIIAAIQGRCCCMIASAFARDNLYRAKASSNSGVMTLKYLPRDPSPRVFWSAGHCSSSLLKKKFFFFRAALWYFVFSPLLKWSLISWASLFFQSRRSVRNGGPGAAAARAAPSSSSFSFCWGGARHL